MTFRRLNPDAPVGLRADACLSLRSRHTECDRCVEVCPAGVLHRGEETFFLDEGCLGCGRCAAVCPMGALAVAGFTLRPTEIKTTRPLMLDCWRVPAEASPPHGVRVPCLGGLSPGQWLGLVLAARGHGVELLDRGWCNTCPASPGAAHPAAEALTTVHDWLKEARVPRQHWPRRVRAPLPATRATTPDPRNETPVSRRRFFGALMHESVGLADTALDAPRTGGSTGGMAPGCARRKTHPRPMRARRQHRPSVSACLYSWRRSRRAMAAACRQRSIQRSRSIPTAATIACARRCARPGHCAPTPTTAGIRQAGRWRPLPTTTAWELRMTRPVASLAASARRPARNTLSVCNPPVPERTRSLRSPAMLPAHARHAASASAPTAARPTVHRAANHVISPAPAS